MRELKWLNNLPEGYDIALILVVTLILVKIIKVIINQKLLRIQHHTNYDSTGLIFARRSLITLTYALGIGFALAKIPDFEIIGHSLIAGAGLITLITGLASQQILSNVFSGLLIVIFKPFKIGDRITVDGFSGTVEDINLRQFILRDTENNRVVIPNSLVGSTPLINFNHTDTRCCKTLEIGISYTANIDKAFELMIAEIEAHPLHIDGRSLQQIDKGIPKVITKVVALGESAITIKAWTWAKDASDSINLYYDLLKSIKEAFDREGIDIPFPQRTLHYAK